MAVLFLLMFITAAVFFALATFRLVARVDAVAAGLLCWGIVFILQALQKV